MRGHPPAIRQKVRHREKVSVAAALWLSPLRDRLGLGWQTLIDDYFDSAAVAALVRALLEWLGGAHILIWDGGTMHKGDPIKELVSGSQGRLELERLPPHAPELMPLEQRWAWLKYGRLCNFAPKDAYELDVAVQGELEAIGQDQERLRSFFHASKLPLPRTLLS